eukprot:CAMPEP_0185509022 /NCGR_PEP_ID=MMETSP1366-20130426/45848_1 /TAXON_ID=38817 /ORGANISM="Gephyrocapsa oceanica, Strain RCC1303" /LENGTH=126 /DNA_ID=CAMNT_0028119429 /DNA_START=155 /DNA_END=530 /DNA_ORIENTATION=-
MEAHALIEDDWDRRLLQAEGVAYPSRLGNQSTAATFSLSTSTAATSSATAAASTAPTTATATATAATASAAAAPTTAAAPSRSPGSAVAPISLRVPALTLRRGEPARDWRGRAAIAAAAVGRGGST